MEYSGCDWDPRKDLGNRRKHGVRFTLACCVLDDPHRTEIWDDEDCGEERLIATGWVGPVGLVVAFTVRVGRERIIFARKANRKEEQEY